MLPAYPFHRPSLLSPPAEYARLRESEPVARVVLPSGDPAWLVTRFDDVRLVLGDGRFGRAALTGPGAPRISAVPLPPELMFRTDPPVHTRLRGQVNRGFARRRSQGLRPRVQELTDELLDDMERRGPPADLVDVLSDPERFDVTRTDDAHIALGTGPHYCLGGALARIEMQVAVGTLVRRFPTLRLAVPESELTWRTGLLGLEMDTLPVTW